MSSEMRVNGHKVPVATKGSEKSSSSKVVELNSTEMTEPSVKSPNKARFAETKMPALTKDETTPNRNLGQSVQLLFDELNKVAPILFSHLQEQHPELHAETMKLIAKGNVNLGMLTEENIQGSNPTGSECYGRGDVNIFALLAQVNNDSIQGNFEAVQGYNQQMEVGSHQLDQENTSLQTNLANYQSAVGSNGSDQCSKNTKNSEFTATALLAAGIIAIAAGLLLEFPTAGASTAIVGLGVALLIGGVAAPMAGMGMDNSSTNTNIAASSSQMQTQTAMSSNSAEVYNRNINTASTNINDDMQNIQQSETQISNSCSNITRVMSLGNFSG